MLKSILIIIPYFGKFPDWSDLYFETLKKNPTVDFFFFTDCDIEQYSCSNINYKKIAFDEYVQLFQSKLNFKINITTPYKICDLRPLFGWIHRDVIRGFDFYGWTDVDLLFGDIRSFYTNEVLSKFEVLSTHKIRLSGHLALFKNNNKHSSIYKKIYNWKQALSKEEFVGIDEHGLTNAYCITLFDKINIKYNLQINNTFTLLLAKYKKRKLYFKEQYTTPFTQIPWLDGSINANQPTTWYYINGKISNSIDGDRNFIYIHFMNFRSSQWRHDHTKAPWGNLQKICYATVYDMRNGITINKKGIYPI